MKIFVEKILLFSAIFMFAPFLHASNPLLESEYAPDEFSFGLQMPQCQFELDGKQYSIRKAVEDDLQQISSIYLQKTPATYPYQDLEIFKESCDQCQEGSEALLMEKCATCSNRGTFGKCVVTPLDEPEKVLYTINVSFNFFSMQETLEYFSIFMKFFTQYSNPIEQESNIYDGSEEKFYEIYNNLNIEDCIYDEPSLKKFQKMLEDYYSPNYKMRECDLNALAIIARDENQHNLEDIESNNDKLIHVQKLSKEEAKAVHLDYINKNFEKFGFSSNLLKGQVLEIYNLVMKNLGKVIVRTDYYGLYDGVGKGVFTEALKTIRDYYFQNPEIGGICNVLALNNIASKRVNEKIGGQQVTTLAVYRDDQTLGHPDDGFFEEMAVLFTENKT